jgi:arylsulfatase A-like enzyme
MKRILPCIALLFACLTNAMADPEIDSWYTQKSGAYARIFQLDADVPNGSVTSWIHPGGGTSQTTPTYAGIHELSSTPDWVYIRTSGLGGYMMGPWYTGAARTTLFPGYPINQAVQYRFPRSPADPLTVTPKTITGGGPIGYFVNGVAMFDSRDAFSYSIGAGGDVPNGGERWNRDAYFNERLTFDASFAHQANGNYHYHASPPALRYQLGDSVDYNAASNTYTENFNGKHSPILAWNRDGLPLYGPYGFSDPLDSTSGVRRMISGFQIRAGLTTRDVWPAWATRVYTGAGLSFQVGPDVSPTFPLGRYMEDNDYKGDLGMTLGVEFDINEFNARFCATPEFPAGTWAYFVCIDPNGTPVYPYNINRTYFGDPVGGVPNAIPDSDEGGAVLTTYFEGGPEKEDTIESLLIHDPLSDDITIVYSGVEGGSYEIQNVTNLETTTWTPVAPAAVADSDTSTAEHTGAFAGTDPSYYRSTRTGLAPFDDTGFDYTPVTTGHESTITVTLAGDGGQGAPPVLTALPVSLTYNGVSIDLGSVSRPSQQEITFNVNLIGLAPGSYQVVAVFQGPAGTQIGTYTIAVPSQNNILLLIVDDWGIDSSPIDNNTTLNPGTTFPTTANIETLASQGIRFMNGYSQPVCSPMRAAMLTGRQAWRTGVGAPGDVLLESETTLPDAFLAASSPYALASFGKWHLGGGDTGYSDLGGWPHFVGLTGGGAQDYFSWPKNNNGSVSNNTTTYTTIDQVNEAKSFIDAQELGDTPWFVWMGFNAPHTPFHEPPAGLLQGGTGTTERALYEKAIEALDTEIGRLLLSVDTNTTTIILVGDNGTPGQVVQAPFGPTGATGHSKGDLYEGGIHVPFVVAGPDVTLPAGSTSDRFVHVVDLYSTILEIAGVPVPASAADATSILPILQGTDTANRCIVTETFNNAALPPGRSIRMESDTAFPGSDPDYKLIIFADPNIDTDTPTFEFYNIALDQNEASPLTLGALTATAQAAFDALVAKDAFLGGGYSDFPAIAGDVVYLELPNPGVPPIPGNINVAPDVITINGATNNIAFVSRSSYGADLGNEADDTLDTYWIKCTVSPTNSPYTTAEVDFPDSMNGNPRIYTATNVFEKP